MSKRLNILMKTNNINIPLISKYFNGIPITIHTKLIKDNIRAIIINLNESIENIRMYKSIYELVYCYNIENETITKI